MSQGWFSKGIQGEGLGSPHGIGYNNITNRGGDIIEELHTPTPSKNIVQAHFKALRLFRRACRLMPFLLRIHELTTRVTPVQANLNVAKVFREKQHIRDPSLADYYVYRGYQYLSEAEFYYTQDTLLLRFVCPPNSTPGDRGYSYLEEKKFGTKSKFLKDFYKGKQPNY